jgi:hypothetical protein
VRKDEVTSWLGGVCQLAVAQHEGPEPAVVGCACCAPFDECQPGTSAEPVENVFAPSARARGSFTRAGADELALTMPGCESHAENYGGLLLLERRAGTVVLKRYVSGLNASACWAVRRADGRDLLLCERGDVHQGTGEDRLFLWDLARTDEQLLVGDDELFSVMDNEWSGCWSPIGTEVSSIRLAPPQLRSKAGRVELTLQLDARRGRVTAPYLARCRAIEDEADPGAAQALPRPRALLSHGRERVVFRFDGWKFVAPAH